MSGVNIKEQKQEKKHPKVSQESQATCCTRNCQHGHIELTSFLALNSMIKHPCKAKWE